MDFNLTIEQQQIREEIKKVCKEFPDAYWRKIDAEKAYPDAFVKKLGDLGWLAALIPEEFGGTGLGITEASIILEEINHSGGVATPATRCTPWAYGHAEKKRCRPRSPPALSGAASPNNAGSVANSTSAVKQGTVI
jgi:alkylation response protein AidB-like acyl-CoA dehydrogenase